MIRKHYGVKVGSIQDLMQDDVLCCRAEQPLEWMPNSLPISGNALRRPSLGFEATSASDLAEIMCCIDSQLFRKVPVSGRVFDGGHMLAVVCSFL